MNIYHSALGNPNRLHSNMNQCAKAYESNLTPIQKQVQQQKAVPLNQLVKGQVFQGEIVDVVHKSVTIKLPDLTLLKAMLGETMDINIGSSLYFEVKENQDNLLVLKPIIDDTINPQNKTIEKALTLADMQLNEKNMTIVKELLSHQMPIDKQSIQKILQQSLKFPDTSIKNLVAMNKIGLPINETNTSQITQYESYHHQVKENIEQIAKGTFETLQLSTEQDIEAVAKVVLKEIFGNEPKDVTREAPVNVQEMATLKEVPQQKEGSNLTKALEVGENIAETKEEVILLDRLKQDMVSLLKQGGYEEKECIQIVKALPSVEENTLLPELVKQLKKAPEYKHTLLKELFTKEWVLDNIKNELQSKWSLTPKQLEREGGVKEYYKTILEASNRLLEEMNLVTKQTEVLSKNTTQLKDNINFMNSVNQLFAYTQLPMKLQNQEAHGELYVFTNKKRLSKREGNINILLHLDMERLGPIDIYVTMAGFEQAKQTISTKFCVNDEESMALIEENIGRLQEKIEEKGFRFSNQVELREEEVDFVEDFLLQEEPVSNVKRYTFDVRM